MEESAGGGAEFVAERDAHVDIDPAEAAELIAALRAGGSVFAEEELAELLARAVAEAPHRGWDVIDVLDQMVERRVAGDPIEHIVGSARFAELRVAVEHGVFVPRRRTELLATIVADRLRELAASGSTASGRPRLLDFGCGTGAIAALAIHRVPGIDAVAVDRDRTAVDCARRNLPGALVVQAERIEALVAADAERHLAGRSASAIAASDPFDVVAANLPYVPTEQLSFLPRGTIEAETREALDGGEDGLEPLALHAQAMAEHLRPGGIAVTEVAPHQVELASEILLHAGFESIEVHTDGEIGATAIVARR